MQSSVPEHWTANEDGLPELVRLQQNSSKLLRVNTRGRPFARDFYVIYCTLVTSLPLQVHRVRFRAVPNSFTSEDAIKHLGSLSIRQQHQTIDPRNSQRIVTTTNTQTFTMAAGMAKNVYQRFIDARLVVCVSDRDNSVFGDKLIWKCTPKGLAVLQRYARRLGADVSHIKTVAMLDWRWLILLERDPISDRIASECGMTEMIFKRFAGTHPNTSEKLSSDLEAESDIVDEVKGCRCEQIDTGIYVFNGASILSWLVGYTSVVDVSEAQMLANLMLKYEYLAPRDESGTGFVSTSQQSTVVKELTYTLTEMGRYVAGWANDNVSLKSDSKEDLEGGESLHSPPPMATRKDSVVSFKNSPPISGNGAGTSEKNQTRQTSSKKLMRVLEDSALRALFREFLQDNFCEENLSYWLDSQEFDRGVEAVSHDVTSEGLKDVFAMAYAIYHTFLASGAPRELNVESTLRGEVAKTMTGALSSDDATVLAALLRVRSLYARAQAHIFRLMATDSLSKFELTKKYLEYVRDFDTKRGRSSGTLN